VLQLKLPILHKNNLSKSNISSFTPCLFKAFAFA
jgi:hypothetical protein